jgi:MFS family permease
MVETLGVSEARVGLVMTVFFTGGVAALPLSGYLMDAYGRRPVILALFACFGIAGTAIAFVRTFELVLLLRFFQGVGFVGTIPLSVTLVGDLYDGPAGASAQGLRIGASGLARIVVPAIAGVLAGIAWHVPFLLNGAALLAFLVVYRYLPETRAPTEDDTGETDGPTRSIVARVQSALRGYAVELRDPALAVLLGGVFLVFLARFTITTYVPLYAVRSLDASYATAGLALSVMGVPRLVVAPFAGSVTDRVPRRTAFVATIGVAGAGIALVGLVDAVAPLFVAVFLLGFGDALYNPILNNTVTGMTEPEYRGRITSIMETLKTGAIALSPAVFGLVLAATGYDRMFLVAGALALLPAIPTALVLDGSE